MSDVYIPNPNNNPAGITIALDGDTKAIASLRVGLEAALDRTAHSQQPATDSSFNYPLRSRTLTRWRSIAWAHWQTTFSTYPGDFRYDVGHGRIQQFQVGSVPKLLLPLDLPNGCVVKSIIFPVQPDATHVALPSTPPTVTFYKRDVVTLAGTAIVTAIDTTSPFASYNARHNVPGLTGLNETIDTTANVYYLEYAGESGANSIGGLLLDVYGYTFVVTEQDPGAA